MTKKFFARIGAAVLALACSAAVERAHAQGQPLGSWRSHLPYNKVVCAASDGTTLYVAGVSAFYTYNLTDDETVTYAKEHGMSDVGMKYIAYDALSEYAVLAYENANIDLFKAGSFYNIPFLKLKNYSGDKSIYHILIDDLKAYLSTGLGVIVIDLEKKEVKDNYTFYRNGTAVPVRGLALRNGRFYAATDNGLFSTPKTNPNIQATNSWQFLDSNRSWQHVVNASGRLFAATVDSVFYWDVDSAKYAFSDSGKFVRHLDSVNNGLVISYTNDRESYGGIITLNDALVPADSFESRSPRQVCQTADGSVWVADDFWGLRSRSKTIIPPGPNAVGSFDILAENDKVIVAHGAYDERWNIKYDDNGFSAYDNGTWTIRSRYNTPNFDLLRDAVRLAKDPTDGTLYIASQTDGLFYLKTDNSTGNLRDDVFEPHLADRSTVRLSGVAFDSKNNLWVTQTDAQHELMARSASDGSWNKFALFNTRPRPFWENGAAGLVIDDDDRLWFYSPAGGGVLVYDYNGTLEDQSDDTYTRLTSGGGNGNLPENNVQSILKDKKGSIWVGTSNGIGIINCPEDVIAGKCEAEIRVVKYDDFAGQLFSGETVKAMAADGANRKWIGTGNGVWLLSEDAQKIIQRFTTANSPLPSNNIQTIAVDPVSGTVYFGTDEGMVSWRGNATDGGSANKDVLVFPNPIKHDYSGTIAIKGLVNNADVRITDVSGQVVYRTKAAGGTATWSGLDYKGRRPQSGVYLIFATNNDGTERYAGKMVFIN